ncbi:MAG: Slp family lipoprotein [Nitrospiria bacterium]
MNTRNNGKWSLSWRFGRVGPLRLGLFYILMLFLASCGPKIIPDDIDAKIDKSIVLEDLMKNPGQYLGKRVLLGGEIIEIHVFEGGSEVEILQKPLNARRAPRLTDASLGRFFLADTVFLDPAIYKSGRRVTVVGVVRGSKAKKIGEAERRYPVLAKEHLHLWAPDMSDYLDGGPRFSFGFGAIIHD